MTESTEASSPSAVVTGGADWPLSSMQKMVWLDQVLNPPGLHYHIGISATLPGPVDPGRLREAAGRVMQQHDTLRLGVDLQAQPPVQRLMQAALPFEELAVSGAGEERLDEAVQQWLEKPFPACGLGWGMALFHTPQGGSRWALRCHHAVCDGLSVVGILQQVCDTYSALLRGEPAASEPAPSYAEALRDDAAYLASPRFAADQAHWQRQFETVPAPLLPRLPSAQASPPRSEQVRWEQPRAEYERMERHAQAHGASVSQLVLALVAVYLARVKGRREVVLGLPVHNRPHARAKNTLGMFSSMIPLRLEIDLDQPFEALLAQVVARVRQAYRHQRFPIAELNRQLKLLEWQRSQVFDVSVSVDRFELDRALGALRPVFRRIPQRHEPLPLAITLHDYHRGLGVPWEVNANTAHLTPAAAGRLLRHLRRLLGAVLEAAPGQPAHSLPLLDEQDLRQLQGFNDTRQPFPAEATLHQLFEAQVLRTPDARAVKADGRWLSYAELNRRANQVAHLLRARGVGPQARVAVCMERGLALPVALMGVLKAGAAYVPLDPDHPPARLAMTLEDAAPQVILTQQALLPRLPADDSRRVTLEDTLDALAGQPEGNPAPWPEGLPHSRSLAYVIYTSGSTGQPKGAMNEHRAVVNRLHWMQQAFPLSAGDRVLQKTPFGFDVSVWEFFWPLLQGAGLVMARPHGHQDPAYLRQVIREEGISVLHFVPSMLSVFLGEGPAAQAGAGCDSLRLVFFSGEALPTVLQNRALQAWPQAALHNLYGPTEAAIDVTAWRCQPLAPEQPVPIGRPIANVQIHVLDPWMQPVPIGETGEIHIGGVGVARGYLNRPELTAERFLPDTFTPAAAGEAPAQLYRTGDLGRWREDGAIDYLGRNDHQVKIRGQRVELGEIEARLQGWPGVQDAVVTAREETAGDLRLVAYVTRRPGQPLDTEGLPEHLARHLPRHMLPSAYVALDHWPVTANGKLDRNALPAPGPVHRHRPVHEAPLPGNETLLAGLWQALLQVESISRHDNLFHLGGHSLTLVQLAERLRGLGLALALKQAFAGPTLAQMAAALQPLPPAGAPAAEPTPATEADTGLTEPEIQALAARLPGGAANLQDLYPLAPLQQGLLFHHLMDGPQDAYLLSAGLTFDSAQHLDGFARALQAAVQRHDPLRTAIVWQGLAAPVQVVLRELTLPVHALPLAAGQTPVQALDRMMALGTADGIGPLALDTPPLLRLITWADPAGGACAACLQLHHIISDHVSLELLLDEVRSEMAGPGHLLPTRPPYRHFVAHTLAQAAAGAARPFFEALLGDVDEPTAPFGLMDVRGNGRQVEEATLPLPRDLVAASRAQARRHGASPAALMHLAWALVVARCSGREDPVFGSVLLGRLEAVPGSARMMGLFINTLPLRLKLGGCDAATALQQTRQALAGLMAHEAAPLAEAQQCSGLPADVPLFTAVLNYRHSRGSLADLGPGVQLRAAHERSNYPFTLSVDDLGEDMVLHAQVDRRVGAAHVGALVQQALARLVQALADAAATPVLSLDLLPVQEQARLRQFSRPDPTATPTAPQGSEVLHRRFQARALAAPQAPALVHGSSVTSYGELDRQATRWAHALRRQGVQPGDLVALCMQRSPGWVTALLAVLKAGAAYLPIDTHYPAARIAGLLADAKPRLLLTDAESAPRLPAPCAVPVHELAPWSQQADRQSGSEAPLPAVEPGDLACVIFTSGSTGLPKGVMVEHRQIDALVHNNPFAPLGPGDCVVHAANPAFDATSWEVWGALVAGARLLIVPQDTLLEADRFCRLLQQGQATAMFLTAALFSQQAEALAPVLPQFRHLLVGGEPPEPAVVAQVLARGGPQRLLNGYGPTETTTFAATHEIREWPPRPGPAPHAGPGGDSASIPIGRPIAGTELHVLDRAGRPVPVGAIGEIFIGGAGVARGYLHRPELTAERFVSLSAPGGPTGRFYRTGDLGRWRADGLLECLGRNDRQVKLRGFRIELGEIEAALAAQPGIARAVVVARDDLPGSRRLVAYVTASQPATAPEPAALRQALRPLLPDYMLPAAVVVLPALPLTANGKLDHRALPAPPDSAADDLHGQAPQGPWETALATLWSELLGQRSVHRHDHFFDLGGHSLLAVQLASRVHRDLGTALGLRELFDHPCWPTWPPTWPPPTAAAVARPGGPGRRSRRQTGACRCRCRRRSSGSGSSNSWKPDTPPRPALPPTRSTWPCGCAAGCRLPPCRPPWTHWPPATKACAPSCTCIRASRCRPFFPPAGSRSVWRT